MTTVIDDEQEETNHHTKGGMCWNAVGIKMCYVFLDVWSAFKKFCFCVHYKYPGPFVWPAWMFCSCAKLFGCIQSMEIL